MPKETRFSTTVIVEVYPSDADFESQTVYVPIQSADEERTRHPLRKRRIIHAEKTRVCRKRKITPDKSTDAVPTPTDATTKSEDDIAAVEAVIELASPGKRQDAAVVADLIELASPENQQDAAVVADVRQLPQRSPNPCPPRSACADESSQPLLTQPRAHSENLSGSLLREDATKLAGKSPRPTYLLV
jgi:hypothetical protein